MISVVLDTNVLVAGLRSKRGTAHRLLNTLDHDEWRPNVSVALALEYEDVLKRPGIVPAFTFEEIDDFLDYIFSRSSLIPAVWRMRPALRDSNDDRILEVAVRCEAVIVTYNLKDFKRVGEYGLEAVTPAEFLQRLRRPA